jgi:hypothetical protein
VQHIKGNQACQASSFSSRSPGIASMHKGKVAWNLLKKQPKKKLGEFWAKNNHNKGTSRQCAYYTIECFFFLKPSIATNACKHHDYVFFEFSFGCEYRNRSQKPCWIVVKIVNFLHMFFL